MSFATSPLRLSHIYSTLVGPTVLRVGIIETFKKLVFKYTGRGQYREESQSVCTLCQVRDFLMLSIYNHVLKCQNTSRQFLDWQYEIFPSHGDIFNSFC